MKNIYPVLILLSAFFLTGCSSISYYANYDLFLSQMERPVNAVQLYGDPKIDNISNNPKYKFCFEDSLVKISWFADSKQILFLLENKTNHTIKIPWDDAAYVDENSFSHRVIHSNTGYDDKDRVQPPSIIVRRGMLEDSIIPADYVKWIDPGGEHSSPYWNVESFFLDYVNNKGSKEDTYPTLMSFVNAVRLNIGKDFQVLLPLQVQSTVYEYIFTFRIEEIRVNKK